jgi:uncharacterized protein (DUF58 family)
MALTNYRFIQPSAFAAIRDLPLVARTVVDGFMYGAHQSRMPGAGLEFSQYRSYQAGDDLRRVDWKLYGRSDRYFVRESEIETSLTLRLVLDASASMGQTEGLSKFDYSRFLAASLGLLAHRQGDAVGLYALNDGALHSVRPGRGQAQLHRLMHELERLEPAGAWPAWDRVERALSVGGGRGITIVLSDLHERGAEIREAVLRLAARRHEVIVMHVIGRAELNLDYGGPVELEELETGRVIEIDPGRERAAYTAALSAELAAVRREFEGRRIEYARFVLDEPLDAALRAFLAARLRARDAS